MNKTYKSGGFEVKALSTISLEIYKGDLIAITGPSGAGKSTLLRIISGLEPPSSGKVVIDGLDITKLSAFEVAWFRRRKIGFKPQEALLIPSLTLLHNVALPLLLAGYPLVKAEEAAERLLDRLGIGDKIRRRPSEVSGGEAERASLARALIGEPPILVLDEPTTHLDEDTAGMVLELLKEHNERTRATMIVATLDEKVFKIASRAFYMRGGKLILKSS